MIFKLEHWQVEVESTGRKVKILKSKDIFMIFLDLESRNDWWKEDVQENEMNQSNISKLLSMIENPWSMVEKWFLGFVNMEMWMKRWENRKYG